MIPKIIHYVWLGGKPLTPLAEKCLASWKKYCPDYEIKLWNEENFDINKNTYCKQAYENKYWAFASDYVRVCALKEYGGIYFDTDVELIKPIDEYLKHTAFVGMEDDKYVATGTIGCEKDCKWINEFYNIYNNIKFKTEKGFDLTPNPRKATAAILKLHPEFENDDKTKILEYENITVYPIEYFTPMDPYMRKIKLTKNSHAIHHFDASWRKNEPLRRRMWRKIKKIIKKVIFYDKWRKK